MKTLLVVMCVIAFACADDSAEKNESGEAYTSKFDNINLDEILASERLFKNEYNCLMDLGKCPPEGRELKRILPDALKTECKKCSEKQKEGVEKVIRFMIKEKKEEWKALAAKYDPEGIYIKKYKEEAKKHNIEVEDI